MRRAGQAGGRRLMGAGTRRSRLHRSLPAIRAVKVHFSTTFHPPGRLQPQYGLGGLRPVAPTGWLSQHSFSGSCRSSASGHSAAVPAIIFGVCWAAGRPRRPATEPAMSIAGLVLGIVGTIASVLVFVLVVFVRTPDPPPSRAAPTTTAGSTGTSDPSAPPVRLDSPSIYTSSPIDIPAGEPGKLSVVLTGPPSPPHGIGTIVSVPVVVRNNTGDTLMKVKVEGKVIDAGGKWVSGCDSPIDGIRPESVKPGESAIGLMSCWSMPDGGTITDLTATGDTSCSYICHRDVKIADAAFVPDQATVTGNVLNDTGQAIGLVKVTVVCFQDGEPTAVSGRYSPSLEIPAGASVPFTVAIDNTDTCPTVAAAAAGLPSFG